MRSSNPCNFFKLANPSILMETSSSQNFLSSKPHFPNISLTTFSLSCSFKTSPDSDSQQPFVLPVVIRRNGRVYKYFWDCNSSLKLVCVNGEDPAVFGHGGFRRLLRNCASGVIDFFIPKQDTKNYIEYVKWEFLHIEFVVLPFRFSKPSLVAIIVDKRG